jgi:hypothetical protein
MSLKNEFSWSVSRDSKFRFCLRAYYYNYYGSWGGWAAGCDENTREAYVLKQLKSGKMWAGAKVHEAVSHTINSIRDGNEVPLGEARERTIEEMRREWRLSSRMIYRENPKSCALFDHEYGINRPDSYWKSLADDVRTCIGNFYGSGTYEEITGTDPTQWLAVDDPSFDRDRVTFDFEGDPVFAKVDFAFMNDGHAHIIDWKTGRSLSGRDNNVQFHCYGLFAIEKWGIPAQNVRVFESNLYLPETQEIDITDSAIDRFRGYMRNSIRDMRTLLIDGDNNVAEMDSFPQTEGKHCRWCNFFRLCFPQR